MRYIILLSVTLAAAGCDFRGDAARARARQDSLANLGPGDWNDAQLAAYLGVVSATLTADLALVQRRSRSVAVVTFARRLGREHTDLMASLDSLMEGETPVRPPLVSESFRAHETLIRQIQDTGRFDLPYVTRARETIEEALAQLESADSERRTPAMGELLGRARIMLRGQLNTASQLHQALRRVPTPAKARTKR